MAMNQITEFQEADIARWAHVFEQLKNYILVELCDPEFCEGVVQVILKFCNNNLLAKRMKVVTSLDFALQ